MVSQAEIEEGLKELGLKQGDVVLAHSSLSRFGLVEGGAEAVIDALLAAVGPQGTLMMPAMSASLDFVARCIRATQQGVAPEVEPFDPSTQPVHTGIIPETFRRRRGVLRSLHPTHSTVAFGPAAEVLLHDHETAPGPCGEGTPYTRLTEIKRGFILLLGVDHEVNTTLHGMEELADCEYVLSPKACRIPILRPEGPAEMRMRLHIPYIDRHLGALESRYINDHAEMEMNIGNARARLISAAKMREITLPVLKRDPFALLTTGGRACYEAMKASGDFSRPTA